MRLSGPLVVMMGLVAAVPARSLADDALDRSVSLIVPFPEGGGNDTLARTLAPLIAQRLGPSSTVNVVNLPGAGGEIGWGALADAEPDGRTIGMIVDPVIQAIPIEREARFTLRRLDPLVALVRDPVVWSVSDDSPLRSVSDVIAAAKARPGKVGIATSGVGSDDDLSVLRVERATGVRFAHVPFEGGTADARAVLARRVDVVAHNLGEALRARRLGPLRTLGVMSEAREPAALEVPTFVEAGVDAVMAAVRGVGAPRGLESRTRERLVAAIIGAANDPEFIRRARDDFQFVRVLGPDAYAQEIDSNDKRYRALWAKTPWGR